MKEKNAKRSARTMFALLVVLAVGGLTSAASAMRKPVDDVLPVFSDQVNVALPEFTSIPDDYCAARRVVRLEIGLPEDESELAVETDKGVCLLRTYSTPESAVRGSMASAGVCSPRGEAHLYGVALAVSTSSDRFSVIALSPSSHTSELVNRKSGAVISGGADGVVSSAAVEEGAELVFDSAPGPVLHLSS